MLTHTAVSGVSLVPKARCAFVFVCVVTNNGSGVGHRQQRPEALCNTGSGDGNADMPDTCLVGAAMKLS